MFTNGGLRGPSTTLTFSAINQRLEQLGHMRWSVGHGEGKIFFHQSEALPTHGHATEVIDEFERIGIAADYIQVSDGFRVTLEEKLAEQVMRFHRSEVLAKARTFPDYGLQR